MIIIILSRSRTSPPLLLRGHFSPNSPIRVRRYGPPGPPGSWYGRPPRPRMMAAATAARFAMRQRMPTIKSLDAAGKFVYMKALGSGQLSTLRCF